METPDPKTSSPTIGVNRPTYRSGSKSSPGSSGLIRPDWPAFWASAGRPFEQREDDLRADYMERLNESRRGY